jgi:acetone carboxylase alpha subunit
MLYLGRSILPNSGGAGKYRGGCSFISTWLISKTKHLRLVTSEHSSRVFDNGGMCGGYPAPSCQMHRAVRNTNVRELVRKQKPLPHSIGTDPRESELERLVSGDHETSEGPYITAPHRDGDIFTHSYNGGGGFGDVLERDPALTAHDVENGFITEQVARQVYGIVLKKRKDGEWEADFAATAHLRKNMRAKRLKRAKSVAEWMANERKRVAAADFVPEVRRMYASAMQLSERFASEFRSFWRLKPDFTMPGEDHHD